MNKLFQAIALLTGLALSAIACAETETWKSEGFSATNACYEAKFVAQVAIHRGRQGVAKFSSCKCVKVKNGWNTHECAVTAELTPVNQPGEIIVAAGESLGDENQACNVAKLNAKTRAQNYGKGSIQGSVSCTCEKHPDGKMVWCYIGTGTVGNGAGTGTVGSSGPQMVKVPGRNFEIGKYEVTQKEWQAVMGSNPSKFTACGENCPVEKVSWNDVQEFLQKLNAQTGKNYRLPSEDEWFYACQGGSQTEYCGGNDLDSVGWYNGNSGDTTHPAGQKQANGYGLFDMTGNVSEWCQDLYNSKYDLRMKRGGSWLYGPQNARAANRGDDGPALRDYNNGFRLARTLP